MGKAYKLPGALGERIDYLGNTSEQDKEGFKTFLLDLRKLLANEAGKPEESFVLKREEIIKALISDGTHGTYGWSEVMESNINGLKSAYRKFVLLLESKGPNSAETKKANSDVVSKLTAILRRLNGNSSLREWLDVLGIKSDLRKINY